MESNKASLATLNAEVRKGKAILRSKMAELEKLVTKKVCMGGGLPITPSVSLLRVITRNFQAPLKRGGVC